MAIIENYFWMPLLLLIALFLPIESTQVLRPRGVSLQKKVFYDPGKDFNCLDGSISIPFMFVNDDYCDCQDGSDEPGTPACPNALFHCSNIGFISKDIPTSRINDGICDCCDGSDEYNNTANCEDNCQELGREAREEALRQQEVLEHGSKIRDQYIKEAHDERDKSRLKIEELKSELMQVEEDRNQKELTKKAAEDEEKVALDKYREEREAARKAAEEAQAKIDEENEQKLIEDAFKVLDLDSDGSLTYVEIQKFSVFDQNNDGVVDVDEAKFFLHMKDQMGVEEFATTGWIIMKPHYMKLKQPLHEQENDQFGDQSNLETDSVETQIDRDVFAGDDSLFRDPSETENEDLPEEPPGEDDIEESPQFPQEEEKRDDEEDDEDPAYSQPSNQPLPNSGTHETPEYDEVTKQLIEKAVEARNIFTEVDNRYLNLKNQIREYEVLLETDYGEEMEFFSLHNQCFELTDAEYTYKFCPFDKASQQPKNGGIETNLGRWGRWTGEGTRKYTQLKMESGAQCWNGPARSVVVDLHCGTSNRLLSTSEPARCEYRFQFETPALCKKISAHEQTAAIHHEHTEL